MTRHLKIYLDTSVINFVFADDAPELQKATIDLFDNYIKVGAYDTYISDFVIQEIEKTPDNNQRERLLHIIDSYPIEFLPIEHQLEEIDFLANCYLQDGVIPPKKVFDALHVASTVIQKVDYLVSWNYKHLANVNRERRILSINYAQSYLHPFRIITPFELLGYESS